jgi:hypothetical protein
VVPGLAPIFENRRSTSFFAKKEAKKLLFAGGRGDCRANDRNSKSFSLLFFKKEALPYVSMRPLRDLVSQSKIRRPL